MTWAKPRRVSAEPATSAEALILIEGARRRLDDLRDRIAAVADMSINREEAAGIRLVVETCRQLVARAERFVSRTEHELRDEPDLEIEHLRSIRTGIDAIHRAIQIDLDYLSRPPLLDAEPLIRPFTRLAKLLTDPLDSELIFVAQDIDRYRVWPDAFDFAKATAPSFSGHDATVQSLQRLPTVAFVTYPSYADSNTFQHAVIAHEVAHLVLVKPLPKVPLPRLDEIFAVALADAGGIEGVRPTLRIAPPSTAEVGAPGDESPEASASDANSDPTTNHGSATSALGTEEQESLHEATARLKSWFDELVCDLVAVRTIGPAYFLALVDYVLPRAETRALPEGELFRTHPPLTWRLQMLVDVAREYVDGDLGVASADIRRVFDQYVVLIDLHEKLEGTQELLIEPEQRLLLDALARVKANIDQAVGAAAYDVDDFEHDLPIVWDKLASGIAPVERVGGREDSRGELEFPLPDDEADGAAWSEPVDWRSILNGGFFFFAGGASADGPLSVKGSTTDQRSADCRVIRGSIELSELLRQMRDLRSQYSVLNAPDARR